MKNVFRIYIDESCHLEHDHLPVMGIGYVKVNETDYEGLKKEIKALKLKYKSPTEIKWNKVSASRLALYKELIDLFFKKEIYFRCVLIKNKSNLNHQQYNQGDHNNFYYKTIYFLLNSTTNSKEDEYKVFLDIKDTRGKSRLLKIKEILGNKYKNQPFIHFQHIQSDENDFLQLTDLFLGAITYKARKEHLKEGASFVKKALVEYLEEKSGYRMDEGTEPWEDKFNIFDFQTRVSK